MVFEFFTHYITKYIAHYKIPTVQEKVSEQTMDLKVDPNPDVPWEGWMKADLQKKKDKYMELLAKFREAGWADII